MHAGTINFDWNLYEEPIRSILYKKVTNHSGTEVSFSPSDIKPNFVIKSDEKDNFKKWLIDKKIAKSVKEDGYNRFICLLTDSFMNEELNKILWN